VPDTRQPGTQSVGPRPGRPSALVLVLHGGSAHGHGRAHSLRLAYLRMLPFARLLARAGSAHGLEVEMVRYRYRGWNAPASDSPVMRLIRPDSFYRRLGANALIGFGEAYLVGGWTSTALADLLTAFAGRLIPPLLQRLRGAVVPRTPTEEHNTIDGARDNIRRHYDLSNELFAAFLDETMTYSSAWFADGGPDSLGGPEDLAGAQLRKINGMLDLAGVAPGQHILEIGTGWGALAIRAAQRGARVTSLTISTEQRQLAERRIAEAGVADRVQVLQRDYREARGRRRNTTTCPQTIPARLMTAPPHPDQLTIP
jgi:cyclopropane-fatty-acyl-phospholipid synthase